MTLFNNGEFVSFPQDNIIHIFSFSVGLPLRREVKILYSFCDYLILYRSDLLDSPDCG